MLVAVILLGSSLAVVGRFVSSVNQGLSDRMLAAQIDWEITNQREIIGSWNVVDITQARIEALPVSASINQRLANARWLAKVTPMTEPARALQVELRLVGKYQGQSAVPAKLTFWVDLAEGHDE
jgi:hypothetical protein